MLLRVFGLSTILVTLLVGVAESTYFPVLKPGAIVDYGPQPSLILGDLEPDSMVMVPHDILGQYIIGLPRDITEYGEVEVSIGSKRHGNKQVEQTLLVARRNIYFLPPYLRRQDWDKYRGSLPR